MFIVTVTVKRPAAELFEHYYNVLVHLLPMKDTDFMDELHKHNLLQGDMKITLESLTIVNERSSYFLDNVLKCDLAHDRKKSFISLLTIMKNNKHVNIKELAEKIENELAVDTKCKVIFIKQGLCYRYVATYLEF